MLIFTILIKLPPNFKDVIKVTKGQTFLTMKYIFHKTVEKLTGNSLNPDSGKDELLLLRKLRLQNRLFETLVLKCI